MGREPLSSVLFPYVWTESYQGGCVFSKKLQGLLPPVRDRGRVVVAIVMQRIPIKKVH